MEAWSKTCEYLGEMEAGDICEEETMGLIVAMQYLKVAQELGSGQGLLGMDVPEYLMVIASSRLRSAAAIYGGETVAQSFPGTHGALIVAADHILGLGRPSGAIAAWRACFKYGNKAIEKAAGRVSSDPNAAAVIGAAGAMLNSLTDAITNADHFKQFVSQLSAAQQKGELPAPISALADRIGSLYRAFGADASRFHKEREAQGSSVVGRVRLPIEGGQ